MPPASPASNRPPYGPGELSDDKESAWLIEGSPAATISVFAVGGVCLVISVAAGIAVHLKMKRGHGRARGRSNEELYKNVNAARSGYSPELGTSGTKHEPPTKRGSNLGASTTPSLLPEKKASSGGLTWKRVEDPDNRISFSHRGSAAVI